MIFPLFRRGQRPDTIETLYGMIVAQARSACFYQEYGVADTVNGRFDMVVLHLALVLERFWADAALRDLGQGLFDHFCRDMDHNLREMGVGDLSVPKKMRQLGEAFYGRARTYRGALAGADDNDLLAALIRNVYGGSAAPAPAVVRRLAAYMREAAEQLAAADSTGFAAGVLRFPDPAARIDTAR